MNISILSRSSIIISVLLIIGILIWAFIRRSNNSNNIPPMTPKTLESKIAKGGIFMTGPETIGKPLIYRDLNNQYYNAGTCSDCPNACAVANPILDVIRTDCINNVCNPVLIQSAVDIANGYIKQAGKNVMNQVDCAVAFDTRGNPSSAYVNNQVMNILAQDTANSFVSIWDFMMNHKSQLQTLCVQFGEQVVLSQFIGEWSIVAMLLPGLMGSDAQARYTAGVNIGVWGGKAFLDFLTRASRYFSSPEIQAALDDGTLEWSALSRAETTCSVVGDYAVEESVAESLSSVLETIGEVLGPVFDIVMFLQLVGMFLDIWDPCGLNLVYTQDDLNSVGKGFDQALFNALLQSTGRAPIEWYADYIQEYGLLCPKLDDSKKMNKSALEKITRDAKDLTDSADTSCQDNWTTLSLAYTKQYQDSLRVNALGQYVRPLTQDEFNKKCSDILGIPVNLTNKDMIKTTTNKLQKAVSYASLQLANQNQVVANFITTYWYLVVLIIIALVVLAFML